MKEDEFEQQSSDEEESSEEDEDYLKKLEEQATKQADIEDKPTYGKNEEQPD